MNNDNEIDCSKKWGESDKNVKIKQSTCQDKWQLCVVSSELKWAKRRWAVNISKSSWKIKLTTALLNLYITCIISCNYYDLTCYR